MTLRSLLPCLLLLTGCPAAERVAPVPSSSASSAFDDNPAVRMLRPAAAEPSGAVRDATSATTGAAPSATSGAAASATSGTAASATSAATNDGTANSAAAAAIPDAPAEPSSPFDRYGFPRPAASPRHLCGRRMLSGAVEESRWDAFAVSAPQAAIVAAYKKRLGTRGLVERGARATWTVRELGGERTLEVYPANASGSHELCEPLPSPSDVVIVLTRR